MNKKMKKAKILILIMIIGLFLSGITVFPVNIELNALLKILPQDSGLAKWISFVLVRYNDLEINTPQLLYGYDWLGFAHIVLAILFIGPYKDPVKNIWVIEFGMIASVLIFPLAIIAGHFRGIPIEWRLIDCSFGVIAFIVLFITRRLIKSLNYTPQS